MRALARRVIDRITVALCVHQWTIPQIVNGRMCVRCFKCDTLSVGVELGKEWRDRDQLSRPETTNREGVRGKLTASAEATGATVAAAL